MKPQRSSALNSVLLFRTEALAAALREADRGVGDERLEVGPDRPNRRRRVVDERALGGPAAERLNAERARAREQVEHPCVADALAEDAEQRLADAVRGGARVQP